MFRKNILFCDYYEEWINLYKKDSVRPATMKKYMLTLRWLKILIPNLKIKQLDRANYQKLINAYAENHEKQTTIDFHCQVKAAITDALDEGLIKKNPTRKVIIGGKMPKTKGEKYLSLSELQKLTQDLNLENKINNDWLIYLISKTGLRFSEAVGLTPADFDFNKLTISINKTWNYKEGGGFDYTKNNTSTRTISIDKSLNREFKKLCSNLSINEPIFINGAKNIYNSTINDTLKRHCKNAGIPNISIHGLRHTHASILLYSGVSILSVSKRLGHSNIAITQKVYLHIILELENKDKNKIIKSLESF